MPQKQPLIESYDASKLITRLYTKRRITSGGCWEWVGARSRVNGYCATECGRKTVGVHRVSYSIFKGQIPEGKHVLHICDNPPCFNPNHLKIGTHLDNMNDRTAKGRTARGSRMAKSKLTEIQVLKIRSEYDGKRGTQRALAKKYGVSFSVINEVVNWRTWRHVF